MEMNVLPLAIKVWEDGTSEEGPYLAYASDLKLVAGGMTPQEAKEKLLQIIADILVEESEKDTLNKFLTEVGFRQKNDSEWIAPEISLVQIPVKKSRA